MKKINRLSLLVHLWMIGLITYLSNAIYHIWREHDGNGTVVPILHFIFVILLGALTIYFVLIRTKTFPLLNEEN